LNYDKLFIIFTIPASGTDFQNTTFYRPLLN